MSIGMSTVATTRSRGMSTEKRTPASDRTFSEEAGDHRGHRYTVTGADWDTVVTTITTSAS